MPGPTHVTDVLSNFNDQHVTAAKLLGRSKHRQAIFEAVYRGKKQVKTIDEIRRQTNLSHTHVLKEGGKIDGLLIEKVPGGYKKRKEFATRYRDILGLARNKKRLEKVPTKTSPRLAEGGLKVIVEFPSQAKNAEMITIDLVDSFKEVRKLAKSQNRMYSESKIKEGFQKIIGENGSFKDWGGERSDLYTTRIRYKGRRISAAIAFKGPGTKGKLVPKKMGKNGDQIIRLFDEPAQLFLVVYNGQIDSSIVAEMRAFAIGKAISGQRVYYGVVDEGDFSRIVSAYPAHFS